MKNLSIRIRLTIWYGLLMSLTIAVLGAAAWFLMARSLRDRIDASLDFEFHEAAERIASGRSATDPAATPSAFHEVYHLRILDKDHRIITESPALIGIAASLPVAADAPVGPSSHTSVRLGSLGECRLVSGLIDQGIIQIATSLESYQQEMAELTNVLRTILPMGLAAATAGGYWLAGRALAPVGRMTEAARRISAANLGERIEPPGRLDELGLLAETINAMLDRIDQAFQSVRRFTADAAHEIRTPLATIRTEAEVALAGPRSAEADAETLRTIIDETERLARLTDRLLILSRDDAGGSIRRESVRLDAIVHQSAENPIRRIRPDGLDSLPVLEIIGDPDLLRLVFDNLLDNAEKAGGSIRVDGRLDSGSAVIDVIDTGIGIPAEALPRVFDRFYRVDPSRSRRTGGNGLGLSLVKAVVERHGGTVNVRSAPGSGSTFQVAIPSLQK